MRIDLQVITTGNHYNQAGHFPPSIIATRIMLRIIRNNLRYDHKQIGGAAYTQIRTAYIPFEAIAEMPCCIR